MSHSCVEPSPQQNEGKRNEDVAEVYVSALKHLTAALFFFSL